MSVFILEEGKQTISCAPYSHDNVEPAPAENRAAAQEACAAVSVHRPLNLYMSACMQDPECTAYNWVDGNAEGQLKNKVYSCTAMHEVHSGVVGWELGVRAGTIEPFAKKEEEARTWTLYSDM